MSLTTQQMNQLEEAVVAGRLLPDPPPPEELAWLYQLALLRCLRTGPSDLSPALLLQHAHREVNAGQLPMETPAQLRRRCEEARTIMVEAGAWRADQPTWWEPLPTPSALEENWNHALMHLPEPEGNLLQLPGFLEKTSVQLLHEELQAAAANVLPLERAGVGNQEDISNVRTDEVCYITGLETGLLQAAPNLTALIRRLLTDATPAGLFAPQSVMLARYEGPTQGYRPHVDNPGGLNDNGRTRTFTLYLSDPSRERDGGNLAVWPAHGDVRQEPDEVIVTDPGTATLFDARRIPHQVLPLQRGSRWAVVVWYNDQPQRPSRPTPALTVDDLLRPILNPPLPPNTVLFHELARHDGGRISVWIPKTRPRIGLVSTVYGAGESLVHWCRHHLAAGIDHLILIFDHADQPAEARTMAHLRHHFSEQQVTLRCSNALAKLPDDPRLTEPKRIAGTGNSSYAVAARQMLNASAILTEVRTQPIGGIRLDWLMHLDADELLTPQGTGRGGASLPDCFAAADAAGYPRLRFVNHERLPWEGDHALFKINPYLAAATLGQGGWRALVKHLNLSQDGPRPWFLGYFNGKSAVSVQAGALAAGVHGWYLHEDAPDTFLAGPAVFHNHVTHPKTFCQKYRRKAASPIPKEDRLFQPSPVEEAAMRLIEAGGSDEDLAALCRQLTHFTTDERTLLTDAGLLVVQPAWLT